MPSRRAHPNDPPKIAQGRGRRGHGAPGHLAGAAPLGRSGADAPVIAPAWRWRAVLLGACIAVFATGLDGRFVFDDTPAILENPYIRELWPPWRAAWAPRDTPVAGRPVVSLTLALNYAVSGLHPWSYHAVNIAIHAASGLTLFGLLRRILRLPYWGGRWIAADAGSSAPADWLAGAAALLWMIHPVQTEVVTYVSTRTEGLLGLFFLLALYALVRAAEAPRRRRWAALAVAAGVLGAGSKEVMAVAPLVALMLDSVLIAGSPAAALRARRWLYTGLAASWLVVAALLATRPRALSVGFDYALISAADYFWTQCGLIVHYLRIALWPHPLLLDYDGWPVARSVTQVAPQFALLLALGLASAIALLRRHWLGVVGAAFFLILGPTSSFVPIVTEIGAERRMHLPLICVILVMLGLAVWVGRRVRLPARPAALGLLLAGVATPLAAASIRQNRLYAQPERLWREQIAALPTTVRGRVSLANVLMESGRHAEARQVLGQAVQIEPRDALAHYNLGAAAAQQGDWAAAEASFARVLELDPQHARAARDRGIALLQLGSAAEAAASLQRAARLDDALPGLDANLAKAHMASGDAQSAERHMQRAIEQDPRSAEPRRQIALLLTLRGRLAEATAHLDAAAQLAPQDPETWRMRGQVMELAGQPAAAAAAYRRVLELRPEDAAAASNLAWLLATSADPQVRDPAEAVRLAERGAAQPQQRTATALDALAAAYAAAGRFDAAIAAGQEALRAAEQQGAAALAQEIAARLALYRAGSAFTR